MGNVYQYLRTCVQIYDIIFLFLPPSLPQALPLSLPPPSLPHSLTHSLNQSLTHSSTPSLPPSLTHSLTQPLPPSLPPSLPFSLSLSLSPAAEGSLLSSIHWVYSDSDRAGGEREEESERASGGEWRGLLGRAHQRRLHSSPSGQQDKSVPTHETQLLLHTVYA